MSLVNLQAREVAVKVVYYGPGLGGKTSTLQYIHRALKPESRGQLVSLATGVDRTLYFDFLPVKLPKMRGYTVRVQLYTVPGQVHYNSTRKLVLNGCDGVVFVADSQRDREAANIESFENLDENLREQDLSIQTAPLVFQYNKRDCRNLLSVAELDAQLNARKVAAFETVALSGKGIFESLKAITTAVLQDLRRKGIWGAKPEDDPLSNSGRLSLGGSAVPVAQKGSSLSERIVAFAEQTDPGFELQTRGAESGPKPLPPPLLNAGSLSDLLVPGDARAEVLGVEAELAKGAFAEAVRRVGKVLRKAVANTVGADVDGGPALVALVYHLPADRYLRMRELLRRAENGAVSSQDGLFALFFLVDFELARAAASQP